MHSLLAVTLVALSLLSTPTLAQDSVRLDGAMGLYRFEQQVKSEIGGVRGERLVEHSELSLALLGTHRVWGPLSLGLYTQYDRGSRWAGNFKGLDENNKTIVKDGSGGTFQEFWLGPVSRLQWQTLFMELGYAPVGIRSDSARDDLQTTSGDTDAALRTSSTVAYYAGFGGGVPIVDNLHAVFRLEYRVRYYDRRGSQTLEDELVHGTQNMTPLIGVAWTP